MGPRGHGVQQADETSNSLVTHFGQASEASVKVAESVDSGDISDNIANSKDVACRVEHLTLIQLVICLSR